MEPKAPRSGPVDLPSVRPGFGRALLFWLKLGCVSFGGPAGQIAMMHAELVERRRWISEGRFLHALNFCMLLPGPEAQQLAIYLGWLLHRTRGGVAAGTLFVLPSALLLWGLSVFYARYGNVAWVVGVFDGLKPAVFAIVLAAVARLGAKALRRPAMWVMAGCSFVLIFKFHAPFPLLVAAALITGALRAHGRPRGTGAPAPTKPAATQAGAMEEAGAMLPDAAPSWNRAGRVVLACLALWWAPVAAAGVWLGFDHLLVQEGVFFGKAAMVTFGGAYAVLPYVSQQAVERWGWVTQGQMLDGLGLAETTPGPLIMVLQFVGFLGGWKFHSPLSPLLMGTLGAAITTWTTFVPCFLWIFLGAPHMERWRENVRLSAAMSMIPATVVGVMLNLAFSLGRALLFPGDRRIDGFAAVLASFVFAGMMRWKWPVVPVILGSAAAGLIWKLGAGP